MGQKTQQQKVSASTRANTSSNFSDANNLRVDSAHQPTFTKEDEPVDHRQLSDAFPPEELPDSVKRHLTQLIGHLQNQAELLKQREAYLSRQQAEYERDLRGAKITLEQRDSEINNAEKQLKVTEKHLDQVQIKLDEQASHLALQQVKLEQRRKKISRAQSALIKEEVRLQKQQKQVTNVQSKLERDQAEAAKRMILEKQKSVAEIEGRQQILLQFEMQLEQRKNSIELEHQKWLTEFVPQHLYQETEANLKSLEQRSQLLSNSEQLLEEEWSLLQEQRKEFEQQQSLWREESKQQRELLKQLKESAAKATQTQKQAIESTKQQLNQRETSLNQLQAEMTTKQKNILEDRLIMEQLWSELQKRKGMAVLTQEIAETRKRLVDAYREESSQHKYNYQVMLELRESLANQRQTMEADLQKAKTWIQAQHKELELQAARLVAKETQLQQEKRQLDELADQCQQDLSTHRLEKKRAYEQVSRVNFQSCVKHVASS